MVGMTSAPDTDTPATTQPLMSRPGAALAADLALVIVFVVLGRRSHGEQSAVAGTLHTAWPFLAGAAAGHAVVEATKLPRTSLKAGGVVVGSTVAVGMGLRGVVQHDVTPPSFIAVATSFLALLLLGWRWPAGKVSARQSGVRKAPE